MNSTTVIHDSRKTKPLYQDLSVQVFAGMALGALIGWLWPQSAAWMRTLGDLFIRLIAMFVGLIIFCAVVHGIATVREAKKVGRIAIKALIYFEVVTTFALVISIERAVANSCIHFPLIECPEGPATKLILSQLLRINRQRNICDLVRAHKTIDHRACPGRGEHPNEFKGVPPQIQVSMHPYVADVRGE
jgi:L-cystine uptake protein TcyP (sodium:dicarboxylate symporter family)